jgi:HEAT repeat protein
MIRWIGAAWIFWAGWAYGGSENRIRYFLPRLKDADEQVRLGAVRFFASAAKEGDEAARNRIAEEALPSLVGLLEDKSPSVRQEAAKTLGAIGVGLEAASEPLLKAVKDPDSNVRYEAIRALGSLSGSPAVVDALVLAMKDGNVHVRKEAGEVLVRVGEQAVGVLSGLLQGGEPEQQMSMVSLLERIGGGKAAEALAKALEMEDAQVHAAAVESLTKLGKQAVPALARRLDEGHSQVSMRVCMALEKIGPSAEEAVPALLRRIEEDRDPEVRKKAIGTIGKIGKGAAAAVPALVGLLGAGDRALAREAALSLVAVDLASAAPAVPLLMEIVRNEEELPDARFQAASGVVAIDKESAAAAVPFLSSVLEDPGFKGLSAMQVIGALTRIGTPEAQAALGRYQEKQKEAAAKLEEEKKRKQEEEKLKKEEEKRKKEEEKAKRKKKD